MEQYKFSRYNSLIDISATLSALYNSKEDKFLVLKKEKRNLLELSPENIAKADYEVYENLKNINAIVAESKDELEEVILKSKEVDHNNDSYKLIINPTMNCNFKCWYCYESHIVGSKMSVETIQKICTLIDNVLVSNENLKTFDLSFFGGEPLMYYSKVSVPIINHFRQKYDQYPHITFSVSFTSNGYLLNQKIVNHLTEANEPKHFQITLDGNREEHNKVRVAQKEEGSYDKILDAVHTLIKNDIEVLLRINYTAKNLYSIIQIKDDIAKFSNKYKKHLKVSFHRVWQDNENTSEVEELVTNIISGFKGDSFKVTDNNLLDNLKNSCYADKKNEAVINYNGDVFKCTARDFTESNKYGEILADGTINWNEKITTWENIKIQSKACRNCRILPICGGGCHQVNLETKGLDICQMGFDNQKKNEIILNRLSHILSYES